MVSTDINGALQDVSRGFALRHVWFFQAYHAITSKYRRSVLGPFWLAGSMVATSLALSLVMGGIFRQSLHDVLPYVMSGILCWNYMAAPINEGPETFVQFGGVIKNHAFPFMYYIFESVSKNFILFMHNAIVYALVIMLVGSYSGIHWSVLLALPLVTLIVVIYTPLVGMFGARYRDMRFLFPYLGQILFFMTPIFWKADSLQGKSAWIVAFNPLYHVIQIFREPFLGRASTLENWYGSLAFLFVGVLMWLVFFGRYRRRIPFWV